MARYGGRRVEVSDLSCDAALLGALAADAVAIHGDPVDIVEGATVTVYDVAGARVAAVAVGDAVIVGRNDPGGATWEVLGIVTGVEHTYDAGAATVGLTVFNVAALASGPGTWDTGVWGSSRWS